jgi:hypothetical protein
MLPTSYSRSTRGPMSLGTARTMMRSQRLGKHGSGVRRNGLLEEGRWRDIGAKFGVNLIAYLDPAFPPICSIVSRLTTSRDRFIASRLGIKAHPVLRDQVRMEFTGHCKYTVCGGV